MNRPGNDLGHLSLRVQQTRSTFAATWYEAIDRLTPDRLREEAAEAAAERIDRARGALVRAATQNPALLAGAGLIAVLLLYRPAMRLGKRIGVAIKSWRNTT